MKNKMKVIVSTSKEDCEGRQVGKTTRKAFWLSNVDGSAFEESDARDWFEDSYPIDGVDKNLNGDYVGHKATDDGFVRYVMTIVK